jgi:hypothetical protein|tara:strand:- start:959 stop:2104 length:1146 start_codon:yes stop_codon:yes gene_type:complete
MFGRKRKAKRDAAAKKALDEVKFKGSVDDIQSEALPQQGLTKSQKQAATDYMASEKELMPIRRANKMAHFDPDFEDEFEFEGETKKQAPFKGAGGFEYTQNEAGDYEFVGPDGKKGVAKKGTKAYESIHSEMTGGGSLYGTEGYAGYGAPKASEEAGETEEVDGEEVLHRGETGVITAAGPLEIGPTPFKIPEKLPVSSKDIAAFARENADAMANPMNLAKLLSAYDPSVYDVNEIKEKFMMVPRVTAEFDNLQKKREAGTLNREEAIRLENLATAFERAGLRDRTEDDKALRRSIGAGGFLRAGVDALTGDAVGALTGLSAEGYRSMGRSARAYLNPLGVMADAPPIPEEKAFEGMSGADMQEILRAARLNAARNATSDE